MLAKTMKVLVNVFKLVAGYPIDDPRVIYQDGIFSAHNLRNVIVKYDADQPADTFTTTLPLKRLAKVLSKCRPTDEVVIEADDEERPIILVGTSRYELGDAHPLEDFPYEWEVLDLQVSGRAPLPLKAAATFMSKDEGRPHLNCVLLETTPNSIVTVATDGHRLFHRDTLTQELEGGGRFLMPSDAINALLKIGGAESFAWGADGGVFLNGGWQIYTREVDARFPPYEKAMPGEGPDGWNWTLTADRSVLQEAIKRVDIGPSMNLLELNALDGQLILDAKASDFRATERVKDVEIEGSLLRMGVNIKYIAEALQHTEHDKVILKGHGPTDGFWLGDDNVLMPMRLDPK